MHRRTWASLLLAAALTAGPEAVAEVTRFEILVREPFAEGRSFGGVGPYERIVGRVHYELDPDLPQNANVVDLHLAPRNERRRVEASGDLLILTPADPRRGRGALLYGVNNRGNLLALDFFAYARRSNSPRSPEHAGDGFLMRHGFTLVWSGWDPELLPGGDRLRLLAPVARDGEEAITGPVRCEIVPSSQTTRTVVNWAHHGSYPPTDRGLRTATLTHRVRPGDPRVPVPQERWRLVVTSPEPDRVGALPRVELEMEAGLEKGHLYELIYEARDPLVVGVCFTAVRDLVSALERGTGQDNPLLREGRSWIRRSHAFGVSQSGRFLRELVHQGFNEDEGGRRVFEGIIPHVSGSGLGSFNHRFAQPTRQASQHDHHDYPPDRFPFAYGTQTDPVSGRTDGILRRSSASGTAPFILHTQSTAEYWTRSGSLAHTDPLGRRDAEIPPNVRVYFFGGTQHGPAGYPPSAGDGETLANPADYRPFLRTLLLALDRWSRDGTPPPPSAHPTIGRGDLVDWRQPSTGFPDLPGVRYPTVIQQPAWLDFGPRWERERIVDRQPPRPRGDYRVLVPRTDADGNDLGCLRPPEVAVPVATYTGWNVRREDAGAGGELVSLQGSCIPFARSRAERDRSGDPRPSLEERYGSLEEYLRALTAECQRLRDAGWLLPEDADRIPALQRERVAPLFAPRG